jgi:hypothetical protein
LVEFLGALETKSGLREAGEAESNLGMAEQRLSAF